MVRGFCDERSRKNRNDIRRPCTRFSTRKPSSGRIDRIVRIAESITYAFSTADSNPIPTPAAKGSRFRLECRQPHSPACLSTAACVFTDRRNPKRSRCASRGSIRGIRPSTLARKRIPSVPVNANFSASACNRPSRSSRITTAPGSCNPAVADLGGSVHGDESSGRQVFRVVGHGLHDAARRDGSRRLHRPQGAGAKVDGRNGAADGQRVDAAVPSGLAKQEEQRGVVRCKFHGGAPLRGAQAGHGEKQDHGPVPHVF